MARSPVPQSQRTRAKELRRTMTRAETLLWRYIKAHRTGLGFRRQTPIGPFIVDFACHAARIIIEVDGESHDFESRVRQDTRRDRWLAQRGYQVLRFTNDDVLRNLEGVVTVIKEATVARASTPLPVPPPQGGRER